MKAGFGQLLWKEVRQAAPAAVVFLLGIVLWDAFVRSRIGVWAGTVAGGSTVYKIIAGHEISSLAALPLGVLPFWAVWRMAYRLRRDYATPHAHLLLSLPVPGWQLAGAKLMVLWLELTLYALAIVVGCVVVAQGIDFADLVAPLPPGLMEETVRALFRDGLIAGVIAFLAIPVLLALVQLAWVVGRMFPRGHGLVTALAFLGGGWLLLRAGTLASVVLGWLPHWNLFIIPDITVHREGTASVVMTAVAVHPAPFLGMGLAALAFFLIAAWLLEHQLEV